jgi:hypothetical protein
MTKRLTSSARALSSFAAPRWETIKQSAASGFHFATPLYEKNFIKKDADGEFLYQGGNLRGLSSPVGEPLLVEKLAKVHEGKITPEEFASEFGLLGRDLLLADSLRARKGGIRPTPETVGDPRFRYSEADPLDWFKGHAQGVFIVLNLLAAIQQRDIPTIRQFFAARPRLRAVGSWPGQPIQAAREFVVGLINHNLQGVQRELSAVGGVIRSEFHARALIDVVYWKLADLAEGTHAVVRRCEGCGSLFTDKDPRLKHCPGGKCSARKRMRKFRKKYRAAEKGKRRKS